jgi:hypothetical protein
MKCEICDQEIPLGDMLKHLQKHGSGGNKHHAVQAEADGYVFRSMLERDRYLQLKTMQQAGVIRALELQPRFMCVVNGILITRYTADFRYTDVESGKEVIEDTKSKSTRTEAYVVRKKLAEALFGIKVIEVTREMM